MATPVTNKIQGTDPSTEIAVECQSCVHTTTRDLASRPAMHCRLLPVGACVPSLHAGLISAMIHSFSTPYILVATTAHARALVRARRRAFVPSIVPSSCMQRRRMLQERSN
jgi:hypothetical protein